MGLNDEDSYKGRTTYFCGASKELIEKIDQLIRIQ